MQLTFHDAIGFSPALFAEGQFGCVVSAELIGYTFADKAL